MKAGAAQRDVTPAVGTIINHPPRESVGVHDPLFVRALVLDDEVGTSVAVVCCDLIGAGFEVAEELAERVRAELGIDHLLLNCSHPHSSVGLGPRRADDAEDSPATDWSRRTHTAIMDMLAEARDSAVPVTLRAGRAEVQVGFNRRIIKDDGFAGMAPNRDAPAVPWVNVLVAERDVGRAVPAEEDTNDDQRRAQPALREAPVFVLFQHTAHPVIVPDTSCLISADFPGAAVARIHEELGDDCVALFGQGCCGNINGFPLRTNHDNADAAGRKLGDAALKAMADATPVTADTLDFAVTHAELPAQDLPDMAMWQRVVDHITAAYEKGDNPWLPKDVYEGRMKGFDNLRVAIEAGDTPPPWRMDVYALMLGTEWVLTAMPNEMFCQYELWIDEAAPFDRTMTFGYTNGGAGYIAVDEAWARGEQAGYEAACLPNWGGLGTSSRHFGPPAVGGEQLIKDTLAAAWASR